MSADLRPLTVPDLRTRKARAELRQAALAFDGAHDRDLLRAAVLYTEAATPAGLMVDPRVPVLLALLERARVALGSPLVVVRQAVAAEIEKEVERGA